MDLKQTDVMEQLERITESKDFQASVRLKNFLTFVVTETLAGRGANIKAYTIAVSVFGRSSDFDPLLDPIVRVEAGKLRKLLERYYLLNPEEPVLITMPTGTYIPLFAPNQKQKPELLTIVTPPAHSQEPHSKTELETILQRPVDYSADPQQDEKPTLIIAPLNNPAQNAKLYGFISGFTEDILLHMDNNGVVDVVSASMGASYRSTEATGLEDNMAMAARSGARFILHGLVEGDDSAVRVYLSLTDVRDHKRVWMEKYDSYPGEGWMAMRESVSHKVTDILVDTFGVIARELMHEASYLNVSEAGPYEASLLYNTWETTMDPHNFRRAKEALENSLTSDPYNTSSMANLARVYSADHQFAFDTTTNNLDIGMDLAKLAVARQSDSLMGELAIAHNLFVRRRTAALDETLKIIVNRDDLTPYAQGLVAFYSGLAFDLQKGTVQLDQAYQRNPYQPGYFHIVPLLYYFTRGDYELALKENLLLNMPTSLWDPILKTVVYLRTHQMEAAESSVEQLYQLEPDFKRKQEHILYGMLYRDDMVELIAKNLKEAGV